jgi:hypothetical protein
MLSREAKDTIKTILIAIAMVLVIATVVLRFAILAAWFTRKH